MLFKVFAYSHLVLLQPESICVNSWWWKLGDEGLSFTQPRLQFLVGFPEPSHKNLGLLQS